MRTGVGFWVGAGIPDGPRVNTFGNYILDYLT
jgi:hypothetical protein